MTPRRTRHDVDASWLSRHRRANKDRRYLESITVASLLPLALLAGGCAADTDG